MAIPNDRDARLFYRCAKQRFEEANLLLEEDRTTGAVYLAGYGIECILKAMVLMAVPKPARVEMLRTFRGNRAHDYDWLRDLYAEKTGARFPKEINEQFTLVNTWTTELRYDPSSIDPDEALALMNAAVTIIKWADGRL